MCQSIRRLPRLGPAGRLRPQELADTRSRQRRRPQPVRFGIPRRWRLLRGREPGSERRRRRRAGLRDGGFGSCGVGRCAGRPARAPACGDPIASLSASSSRYSPGTDHARRPRTPSAPWPRRVNIDTPPIAGSAWSKSGGTKCALVGEPATSAAASASRATPEARPAPQPSRPGRARSADRGGFRRGREPGVHRL